MSRFTYSLILLAPVLSLLYFIGGESTANHAAAKAMAIPVDFNINETIPAIDQQSIDIAMAVYAIKLPNNVHWPEFDPVLPDRGLTSRISWLAPAKISIGPAAFSSWALLGSTLAHEIEVHGNQSFFGIHLKDIIGLSGTHQAEREAYLYELSNANRFGLTLTDRKLIHDTLSYFYPPITNDSVSPSLFSLLTNQFASINLNPKTKN